MCLVFIMRAAAQKRINKLLERGFHESGDVEDRWDMTSVKAGS